MEVTDAKSGSHSGILYIALGQTYRDLVSTSIGSLRRHGYCGSIRVVSESGRGILFDSGCELIEVSAVDEGFGSRFYKTRLDKFAFDTTLYLDADVLIIAPVNHIWHEVRFGDLCASVEQPSLSTLIAVDSDRPTELSLELQHMKSLDLLNSPHYNTGVLLFRKNDATVKFFREWHREWKLFRGPDQLAFIRAKAKTGAEVYSLSPLWNHRVDRYDTIDEARSSGVRILHYTLSQKEQMI
jgi:hypothetical protein